MNHFVLNNPMLVKILGVYTDHYNGVLINFNTLRNESSDV